MQRCDAEARALATARLGGEEAALPQQAANAVATARSDGTCAPEPPAAGLAQVSVGY